MQLNNPFICVQTHKQQEICTHLNVGEDKEEYNEKRQNNT